MDNEFLLYEVVINARLFIVLRRDKYFSGFSGFSEFNGLVVDLFIEL